MLVLTMELRYPVSSGGDREMLRRMVRRVRLGSAFGHVTSCNCCHLAHFRAQVGTVLWATSTLTVT